MHGAYRDLPDDFRRPRLANVEKRTFNQRFEGRLSTDGRTIEAHWEKSTAGDSWEHDLDLTYTKAD